MATLRRERGQTSIEYLGIIVVVAALLGVLIKGAPPAGAAVAGGVRCVIAKVSGGGSCGGGGAASPPTTTPPPATTDPGGPTQGPALDNPITALVPGLPWAGSLSVEGDKKGAGDFEGLYAKVKLTYDQSKCRLGADGRPLVSLGVAGELQVGAKGEAKKGPNGVSLDVYAGTKVKYEIRTDPTTANTINNGGAVPTPVDPSSIPPGTAIILNEDTYKGLDMGGNYEAIRASLGYKDGQRVSSSVQRVDANTVRVTVGDADLVSQSLSLGIGTKDVNVGVGSSKELTSGKTRSVDIDISTPQGAQAYADFVGSGKLPAPGANGVASPIASDVINYSSSLSLEGKLGPLKASLLSRDGAGQILDTTNPDGTHTLTNFARQDGVGVTRTLTTDAAGNPVGKESYTIRAQDVDGSIIDGLEQMRGAKPNRDIDTQDVTLNYTGDQLLDMKERAIDQIVAQSKRLRSDMTRDQVIAALEKDGVYAALPMDPTTVAIAAAKNPADVAIALMNKANGNGNSLVDYLEHFDLNTLQDHPSDKNLTERGDELSTPAPVLGTPSC